MADSILRLKVDSQEYDQKIKRAAEGIQQYAQKCRDAGGTLQYLDDGVLEFVQALGKMDTVATGTKQQLREMSNALTTLTQTYRGLTDEEKASPFGQELAKGIQQLTERAGQAQDAMMDVQQSIRNAASDTRLFDQMAQGMSVATAGFQGLTGAGKLLGIEMGNDVEVIAKLQAAMAVTNSLTTIQTALQKQSALMQGVLAAKQALSTVAQQAYAVATGEATAAQAAFNVVADANPYGLLLAGIGAVVGAITTFTAMMPETTSEADNMANAMDRIADSLNRAQQAYEDFANSMKEQGFGGQEQYAALYNANVKRIRELKQAGMDAKDPEEKKKYLEEIRKLQAENEKLKKENNERRQRLMKLLRGDFNDLDTDAKVDSAIAFLKDQMKYQKTGGATYRAIERRISELETFWKSPSVKSNGSDTTKTTKPTKTVKEEADDFVEINGLIAQTEEHISNLQQRIKEAPDETTISTLKKQLVEAQDELKRLNNIGTDVNTAALPPLMQMESVLKQLNEDLKKAETPEAYQNLLADIKAINEEIDTFKGKSNGNKNKKKSYEDLEKFNKDYSQIVGGVSSIASGIQQMGVEMPKELQSILGVLTGMSTIMSGIVAILTLIDAKETVQAATAPLPFFANGGVVHAASGFMVPGNNFSGDLVPAYLNSGEMVLNRFQQQALAGTLENGGRATVQVTGHLEGETIVLAADRWGRRTGKGELAFWK